MVSLCVTREVAEEYAQLPRQRLCRGLKNCWSDAKLFGTGHRCRRWLSGVLNPEWTLHPASSGTSTEQGRSTVGSTHMLRVLMGAGMERRKEDKHVNMCMHRSHQVCWLETGMKNVCKYAWPSAFKDTDHEPEGKGTGVASNENIQSHLQMAKAKDRDFSKASAVKQGISFQTLSLTCFVQGCP